MSKQKPTLPKGTRDFAPEIMVKRNYILDTIKFVFQKYGFQPLETPSMENLEVLTGKYGEEGDQLIFKILNSGDFLKDIQPKDMELGYKKFTPRISEKALRYDLTVPFARFVVMNQGGLTFPFRRYQIQPVWRGDRPQKGRYREFYQCDADVVGTDSLLCEAEIVLIINEVLEKLGVSEFSIKINNRKILSGLAEVIGAKDKENDLFVAIDKLDKIGEEAVLKELVDRGFSEKATDKLKPFLQNKQDYSGQIKHLRSIFSDSETGTKGLEEIEKVYNLLQDFSDSDTDFNVFHLDFDITLARGLSYYTGAIFEVKASTFGGQIGSISGGGRYDNLTGAFGLPGLSGIGISFGVDRIFDVMEELSLFPKDSGNTVQVMFSNFDAAAEKYTLPILRKFRQAEIKCEIYPEAAKLKKQLNYADAKKIPFVVIIGSEEIQNGLFTLKNMQSGVQEKLSAEEILNRLLKSR